MKNLVRYLILAVVALLVGWLWFLSFLQISKKRAINEQLKTLPPIEMYTLENETVLLTDFSFDEVKLLIFFNSHCDFCQFELEELTMRLPEFENTEVVLISDEPIDAIKLFMHSMGLHNHPYVGAYHCPYSSLQKYFGQLAAPTTFVYDTSNKLSKRYNGATRIEDLLKAVQMAQGD